MTDFHPFDVVRLLSGIPEHGVRAGARAVVLEVHDDPYLALEVEVVDDDGKTLFVGAVDPAQVQRDAKASPREDPT
jgi:hypothetical protein